MTARVLYLDAETYHTRNDRIITRIREEETERRPKQNTKKEEKLRWDTEEARQERVLQTLDKTAVDPTLAELICVCLAADDDEVTAFELYSEAERPLVLRDLAAHLEEMIGEDTVLVGHNIRGFDVPVLINNWRRAKIRPPAHFPSLRYGRLYGRIYDTMHGALAGGLGFIKLTKACECMNLVGKEALWRGEIVDGSMVAQMYEEGDTAAISTYCGQDVETVRNLYKAQTFGGRWGTAERETILNEEIRKVMEQDKTQEEKAVLVLHMLQEAGNLPQVLRKEKWVA